MSAYESKRPPGVYDAPMALDPMLLHTNGLDPSFAKSRNSNHVAELASCTLGPMPPQQFLDYFLPQEAPYDETHRLSSRYAFNSIPSSANDPVDIYIPLVKALNRRTKFKSRCPGYVFDIAATRSLHPTKRGYMKPHICCYATQNFDIIQRSSHSTRVEFGYAELFIEVEGKPARDFFVDPPALATRSSHDFAPEPENRRARKERTQALGQHVAYVTEILARQHRMFLFSLSLSGSRARILRWERAGCVVTESFDIRERPDLLCEFLWRFAHVDDLSRGHDMTVEAATPGEEQLFRDAVAAHVRSQLEVDGDVLACEVKAHYQPGRTFAIHVLPQKFSTHRDNIRRFVVSRPVVSPLSLTGRGTRGYWALDTSTGKIVFLKDTWRSQHAEELEGNTLRRMNDLGVRYIPKMLWHGDVPYEIPEDTRQLDRDELQLTTTHTLLADPWVCRGGAKFRTQRRQHYRIVVETVGYGLKHVRGVDELLHGTYDVFTAMRDALAKDSRIHRDLSVANIILFKEPDRPIRRGYLIDWDASCRVDELGEAITAGRFGTWAFSSVRMLQLRIPHSVPKHTFLDDMESLLYIVLYCALLWQPHDLTPEYLTQTIARMFDLQQFDSSVQHGGGGKAANALHRTFTGLMHLQSPSLQEWLTNVIDYHHPPRELLDEYAGRWSPEYFDTYWTTFLQSHVLESNNRDVHTLDMKEYEDSITPTPPSSISSSPSPPPAKPSAKRKHPPQESAAIAPERMRTRALTALDGATSHGVSTASLRRSQRGKDKPDTSKQSTGVPKGSSAPRGLESNRRRRTSRR